MVYNHGMASYDPFFRYYQGKNQGITSFAEELLGSPEYRNDYLAQHSIVRKDQDLKLADFQKKN